MIYDIFICIYMFHYLLVFGHKDGRSMRYPGADFIIDVSGIDAFHQILTGLCSRSLHISDWLMCIMFALAAYTYPYVNITSTGLLLGSNEKNECVVWSCCMIFLGV